MSEDFLKSAYSEYNRCLDALKKTEEFQQLKALQGVIVAFGGIVPNLFPISKEEISAASTAITQPKTIISGKREEIERIIKEAIIANGRYAHKKDIHQYFSSKGFEISENNLGWYLTKGTQFTSDRTKGWSLKQHESESDKNDSETNTAARTEPPAAVSGASQHDFLQTDLDSLV